MRASTQKKRGDNTVQIHHPCFFFLLWCGVGHIIIGYGILTPHDNNNNNNNDRHTHKTRSCIVTHIIKPLLVQSPLLQQARLLAFPPLSDMLKFGGSLPVHQVSLLYFSSPVTDLSIYLYIYIYLTRIIHTTHTQATAHKKTVIAQMNAIMVTM